MHQIFDNMRKILVFASFLIVAAASAQTLSTDYLNYIEKYRQAAVDQEITHHIPASITLAQGLLESGAGKSELAVKANNHFGIKCHKDWTGATFTHDDETKNECFRSYDNAAESFNDHALFLMRPRYESLFALDIKDYKGWARGLKECGYATDKNYASKLIKIIEDYDLVAVCEIALYSAASKAASEEVQKVEAEKKAEAKTAPKTAAKSTATKSSTTATKSSSRKSGKTSQQTRQPNIVDETFATANGTVEVTAESLQKKDKKINPAQVAAVDLYQGHKVHRKGVKKYVIADAGDTYAGIAAEFNIELKRIIRYNGLTEHQKPQQGEKVFLTGKK